MNIQNTFWFSLVIINRLIPVAIVIFRYIMVCKAILAFNMGDKALANIVYKFTIWIPVLYGITTIFYLKKLDMFLLCMGKEEQFLFQIPHFFEDPSSGTEIKLPLLNPFRLSFNVIAFSFVFIVPMFYFLIYKFRKSQTNAVQGP